MNQLKQKRNLSSLYDEHELSQPIENDESRLQLKLFEEFWSNQTALELMKVKNSIGDGFRGASISIGEKDKKSTNEIKAYQASIWHKNPKVHLPEFNLRSLEFESIPDETAVEDVKLGRLAFRYPFLKGKDHISCISYMIYPLQYGSYYKKIWAI